MRQHGWISKDGDESHIFYYLIHEKSGEEVFTVCKRVSLIVGMGSCDWRWSEPPLARRCKDCLLYETMLELAE